MIYFAELHCAGKECILAKWKYVFMEDSPFSKCRLPLREGDQQMIDGAVSSEWPLERFIAEKSVMSFANSWRGKSGKSSFKGTGCLNYRKAFGDNEKIWRLPAFASRDLQDEKINWNYDFEALYQVSKNVSTDWVVDFRILQGWPVLDWYSDCWSEIVSRILLPALSRLGPKCGLGSTSFVTLERVLV
jgi:hypothetical protein